jgi:hypothetical protein
MWEPLVFIWREERPFLLELILFENYDQGPFKKNKLQVTSGVTSSDQLLKL